MKGLTAEEKASTIKSFVDEIEDGPALTVLDRTTLEHWAGCPFMAKAITEGRCNTNSLATASGNEVHDALSRVTQAWIASEGQMSPHDLQEELGNEIRQARPDVQPDAIKGVIFAAYHWAKFLHTIHPTNILGFDGGEDYGQSGQLALDMPRAGVRVTAEIDLFYSTSSPEVIEGIDYKSGHALHDYESVRDSFQFQLHAALIFEKYPDVNAYGMRVHNTRTNNRSHRIEFQRKYLGDYLGRINSAVGSWYTNQHGPTWPAYEKCSLCPAAAICPSSGEELRLTAEDPVAVLKNLIAVEAKAAAIAKALTAYTDANGDLVIDGVGCFGRNAPKASRKADAKVYVLGD